MHGVLDLDGLAVFSRADERADRGRTHQPALSTSTAQATASAHLRSRTCLLRPPRCASRTHRPPKVPQEARRCGDCSDDPWQSCRARRDCMRPGTRAPPRLPSRRSRAPSTDLQPPRPPEFAIRAPSHRRRGRWAGRQPKHAPQQLQQRARAPPCWEGKQPPPRTGPGKGCRPGGSGTRRAMPAWGARGGAPNSCTRWNQLSPRAWASEPSCGAGTRSYPSEQGPELL